MYILHKLFPKTFPIFTCRGCWLSQEKLEKCPYKPEKGNLICYYHTKKNREIQKAKENKYVKNNRLANN